MKIYTIKKACPVCKSNVKGNDELGYFCKNCNIIFPRIVQRGDKLIASTKRKLFHKMDCIYALKIKFPIFFEDENEAKKEGYSPCKCINS